MNFVRNKLYFLKNTFKQFPKSDVILVYAFFVLLFIPMLNINTSEMAQSKKENRMLTKYIPLFSKEGKINQSYGKNFEKWFSDRFWGRERTIKTFSRFRYKILFNNGNSSVFVGKNDWLFTKRFNSIAMFRNDNLFSTDELNKITDNFNKILKIAKQKNIQIYLLLSNDKESIYPEFYPEMVKKVNTISRREQIISHLQKQVPELNIISATQDLLKEKTIKPVFCKTGTHMNNTGSYIEYQALIKEISKKFPQTKLYDLSNIQITSEYDCDKDILNSIEIENYSKENLKNDVYHIKNPQARIIYQKSRSKETDSSTELSQNNKALSPYKIVIMGDSFAIRYKNYLSETFSEVYNIYISAGRDFEWIDEDFEYINKRHPNIIIWATTERFLHRLLTINLDGI